MAATGVKKVWGAAMLLAVFALTCQAQGNQELRNRLSDVAVALSAGNPAIAMDPFDQSFAGYEKLSNYFSALTNAYQVGAEVEVIDQEDTADGIKLSVRWTLHLTDAASKNVENRTAELSLQFIKKKGKWKITSLAPLDFFDPQHK